MVLCSLANPNPNPNLDGVVLPLLLDDLQDVRAVDVVVVGEQPEVHLASRDEEVLAEERGAVVAARRRLGTGLGVLARDGRPG